MLFAPTRVYGSYNLYGSGLPYYRSFVRAHQDAETHRKTCRLTDTSQNNNKDTILSLTCKYDLVSLIKYNVIHHSFSSCSSSQVSLYGPPLNQLCQDDLPRTSNTPLYQSQVPFSGFLLLNHARMTYTNTIKCPVSYPTSTISPPKDLRCPQRDHSTQLSFLGRLQRYLQVPMSSHELGNLSTILNIL